MKTKKQESDFDTGFVNWISSALEYESLRREGKEIPKELQKRLDRGAEWVSNLSAQDYSRLIH